MPTKNKTKEPPQRSHRLMKALSHPLRQRILIALNESESSPNEIATRLGEPLGNVSYHVKVLESCDAIELARTAQVRGAIEHFYRATARPYIDDEHWAEIPISVRRSLLDESLQRIWDDTVEAAKGTGFDNDRVHVSFTPLELDAEGYADVSDLLAGTLERVLEIQAEAINRASASNGAGFETQKSEVVMLHFDREG
ncbi:winged helix-turn-helix transcriptional regulator [Thermoleophilia bacterium SCSIO 60948]|nr:winged helix-turn-helix transcriptional regulator [Thermoleophilia bacterium SCSIO 60948]